MKLKSIKPFSFFKIGEKGEESCLKMKQKILRHCALSFTILMMSISGDKALKMKFKDGKDLINKGLTNENELKLLGFYTSKGKEERLLKGGYLGIYAFLWAVLSGRGSSSRTPLILLLCQGS